MIIFVCTGVRAAGCASAITSRDIIRRATGVTAGVVGRIIIRSAIFVKDRDIIAERILEGSNFRIVGPLGATMIDPSLVLV